MEWVLWIVGGCLILYYIVSTALLGPVTFTAYLLIFGILLLPTGFLVRHFAEAPWMILCKKIAIPCVCAVLLVMGVSTGFVLSGAVERDREKADYIVVLGAGLRGNRVSLTLSYRLNAALEVATHGETIVVSGGQGPGETTTEAKAMKDYLVARGYPEEKIIMEDASTNTKENLRFSRALIEADAGKPIADLRIKIISNDYHCYRAKMLARRQGYENVCTYGGYTHPIVIPSYYIRESMALVKSFLLDR